MHGRLTVIALRCHLLTLYQSRCACRPLHAAARRALRSVTGANVSMVQDDDRSATLERAASGRSASTSASEHASPIQLGACMHAVSGDLITPQATAHAQQEQHAGRRQLMSVAPMMDWTDLYFRQLTRLLSRHTWLYTEMVVDKTLIHNPNRDKYLWFPPEQRPIVCQLGGSDPADLAAAAALVSPYGYDEINLNCGCPSTLMACSPKVAGAGCFGASLMLEPELVAACCTAMAAVTSVPITVKCRLGVNNADSYEQLCGFVRVVSEASPVRHFVVHCRKALLNYSPADNRKVPPLRRAWAYALARDFPHLTFSLNGQVEGADEAAAIVAHRAAGGARMEGAMLGRAAWKRPWDVLSDADRHVFGAASNPAVSRRQVLRDYAAFADPQLGRWQRRPDGSLSPSARSMTMPLLQLFHGEPGGKVWKNAVDASLRTATSVAQVLEETLHCIPDHVLDAPPRRLEPYQQPIAGLTDVELPPSPWANAVVQTPAAAAAEHQFDQKAEEEVVAAVEALQLERTRAVAVMA